MAPNRDRETYKYLAGSCNDISSASMKGSESEQTTLRRRCVANQHLEGVGILHGSPELVITDRGPLARLLSLSVPLGRAEELAGELLAVPGKALNKAEEMAGKALNKAEEMAGDALDRAECIAKKVWHVVHHHHLPSWLQGNNFLLYGHRPPLNSFRACFGSIFRIHTETGNIWTHLLGFVAFVCLAWFFLTKPSVEVEWQEKAVFAAFFMGAVCCLGFSFTFHTCICHSENVKKIFHKLDYCGISLLIIGSFVPWLYYGFYCRVAPQVVYNLLILVLGTASMVFSMWDKFAEPKFAPARAGIFVALGLSGTIPAMHLVLTDGLWEAVENAALGWLVLMAFLYIFGAVIYACRIPERLWPGKFDIWFQSHQIFHVFVVVAAFVHLHGVSVIAAQRLNSGDKCGTDTDVQMLGQKLM